MLYLPETRVAACRPRAKPLLIIAASDFALSRVLRLSPGDRARRESYNTPHEGKRIDRRRILHILLLWIRWDRQMRLGTVFGPVDGGVPVAYAFAVFYERVCPGRVLRGDSIPACCSECK